MSTIETGVNVGLGVRVTLALAEQLFVSSAAVIGSTDSNAISATAGLNTVYIAGNVYGDGDGIELDSLGNSAILDVAESGFISGASDAVNSRGDSVDITNAGRLSGLFSGIDHEGADISIYNSGEITGRGSDAVSVESFGGIIENHGRIVSMSSESAIEAFSPGIANGLAPTIVNYGEISSANSFAVRGDAFNPNDVTNFGQISGGVRLGAEIDYIRNGGRITGNVEMDNGDDVFDGRGGQVEGEIQGGGGNDTYVIDDPLAVIVELAGEGTDELRSLVSIQLFDNLEILNLIGTAAIDGTGDENANTITGNLADNVLDGLGAADEINGLGGKDLIFGSDGTDLLRGQGGDDTVNGGGQNDQVFGGDADDILTGGGGNDLVNGGDGNDVASGNAGRDTINGGADDDTLFGGGGNDIMSGQDDNDVLFGGLGSDSMTGGNGADTLDGGVAADRLDGGRDDDVLRGGADANRDSFVFGPNYDADRVEQFDQGLDDLLLDDALWGGGLTKALIVSTFASTDVAGNIVFDFGSGDVLTLDADSALNGLDIGTLASDVNIF